MVSLRVERTLAQCYELGNTHEKTWQEQKKEILRLKKDLRLGHFVSSIAKKKYSTLLGLKF